LVRTPGPERALGEGYRLLGLGLQFAGGIILFTVGGFLLDRRLGLTPAFTIVGTLLGAVLSFTSVYLRLKAETDAERERRKQERGR